MQEYSNPKRATEPHALPDVEVFYVSASDVREMATQNDNDESRMLYISPGWYYWYCLPGCLPDSEPYGSFETADAAVADMHEQAAEEEE